jgi:hypothetical protein
MRNDLKEVLRCAVLAAMTADTAFAQNGTGGVDQDIATYTEEIRLNPNNASAYTNRGNACNEKGVSQRKLELPEGAGFPPVPQMRGSACN